MTCDPEGVIPVWRDFLTSDAVRTNHTVQRGASCVGALFHAHPEARNSVEITGKWKNCGSFSDFSRKPVKSEITADQAAK